MKAAVGNHQTLSIMAVRSRPGTDRRWFSGNGWLILKAVIQRPEVIGSRHPERTFIPFSRKINLILSGTKKREK